MLFTLIFSEHAFTYLCLPFTTKLSSIQLFTSLFPHRLSSSSLPLKRMAPPIELQPLIEDPLDEMDSGMFR